MARKASRNSYEQPDKQAEPVMSYLANFGLLNAPYKLRLSALHAANTYGLNGNHLGII